jgi:hypothetical protein
MELLAFIVPEADSPEEVAKLVVPPRYSMYPNVGSKKKSTGLPIRKIFQPRLFCSVGTMAPAPKLAPPPEAEINI